MLRSSIAKTDPVHPPALPVIGKRKADTMWKCLTLLLVLATVAVAETTTDADYYSVPHYSVLVGNIGLPSVRALEDQGFLIEWAHDGKAVINVSSDGEELLRHLGYFTSRVPLSDGDVPYPTITEIYASIDAVLAAHPDICRSEIIGTSVQGRDLRAVVVTANPGVEEIEPELRINGGLHGDEKAGIMTTLSYLETLTDNYATSPMCQYIVDNAEVWIIPVINPDGYNSNDRSNANGIDLNRNCSYMGPGGGGGSTAFSEPETQALRDITMQNWPAVENFVNPFCVGLSLHGGAACINTVWNYTGDPLPEDGTMILQQAVNYDQSPGIVSYFGSGEGFWIAYPGASWYATNGDVNDWSYGEVGTVDHTIEVHDSKQVSDWPGVANAHYMAIMEVFTDATYGIWGTVTTSTGDPLDAMIAIGYSDGADSAPLRFCRTDVTLGDYHKTLLSANYDVTATVEGYAPMTVSNVSLGAEERVEVSFIFDPVGIEDTQEGITGSPGTLSVFPNPTSGSCEFSIPATGVGGSLAIYDITGRQVFAVDVPSAGASMVWDCRTGSGSAAPSGLYLARFTSGGNALTERLVISR